jgi:hypothetical protein
MQMKWRARGRGSGVDGEVLRICHEKVMRWMHVVWNLDFRSRSDQVAEDLCCQIRMVVSILVSRLCLYRALPRRCWPVGESELAALESLEGEQAWSEV